MTEGRFEGKAPSKFQPGFEKSDYLNPSDLLTGADVNTYLEKRKRISPFALTQPVNSLARSNEAADFTTPDLKKRFLVYPLNEEDKMAFARLDEAGIPQFAREDVANPDLTAVEIPLNSWRLDSTDFQEQEPTFPAGNGAIEIMNKLGALLGKIYAKTKTLPADFELCQVAYVTGDNEFIKLVPPYSLSPNVDPEELIKRVEKDLNDIDPNNPHENQIIALRSSLLGATK